LLAKNGKWAEARRIIELGIATNSDNILLNEQALMLLLKKFPGEKAKIFNILDTLRNLEGKLCVGIDPLTLDLVGSYFLSTR
jgi:hypothetical protein